MPKRKPPHRRKAEKPPPKCKAILLADGTIVEEKTQKISIIGIFSAFRLRSFPGVTRQATAFLQLVDGVGRYEVVVEIQDLQRGEVIARATGTNVEFPDRPHTVNLMIPIPAIPLAHAGTYDFVVFANGEQIDRQKFVATLPPLNGV